MSPNMAIDIYQLPGNTPMLIKFWQSCTIVAMHCVLLAPFREAYAWYYISGVLYLAFALCVYSKYLYFLSTLRLISRTANTIPTL